MWGFVVDEGISDQQFQIGNQACQVTIIAVCEGWTFLSDLLLFLFLMVQGRTLKPVIAETRKYIVVRQYLESNRNLIIQGI